jgi:hypothetical protein
MRGRPRDTGRDGTTNDLSETGWNRNRKSVEAMGRIAFGKRRNTLLVSALTASVAAVSTEWCGNGGAEPFAALRPKPRKTNARSNPHRNFSTIIRSLCSLALSYTA